MNRGFNREIGVPNEDVLAKKGKLAGKILVGKSKE